MLFQLYVAGVGHLSQLSQQKIEAGEIEAWS